MHLFSVRFEVNRWSGSYVIYSLSFLLSAVSGKSLGPLGTVSEESQFLQNVWFLGRTHFRNTAIADRNRKFWLVCLFLLSVRQQSRIRLTYLNQGGRESVLTLKTTKLTSTGWASSNRTKGNTPAASVSRKTTDASWLTCPSWVFSKRTRRMQMGRTVCAHVYMNSFTRSFSETFMTSDMETKQCNNMLQIFCGYIFDTPRDPRTVSRNSKACEN